MNRDSIPEGQTDPDGTDIGRWESSGIIDVSELFGEDPGELFLFDVQAHSLRDGSIEEGNLVEGGQLAFLINEAPNTILGTYVTLIQSGSDTEVQIDLDGDSLNQPSSTFVVLTGVDSSTINADDFII